MYSIFKKRLASQRRGAFRPQQKHPDNKKPSEPATHQLLVLQHLHALRELPKQLKSGGIKVEIKEYLMKIMHHGENYSEMIGHKEVEHLIQMQIQMLHGILHEDLDQELKRVKVDSDLDQLL